MYFNVAHVLLVISLYGGGPMRLLNLEMGENLDCRG